MIIHPLRATALVSMTLLIGCSLPEIIKPLNLYDTNNGNTIELIFNPNSREHGTITSSTTADQRFHGECVFSTEQGYPRPNASDISRGLSSTGGSATPKDFAEAYGFTKESTAKPVGTGIIVGDKGLVIELVFYHCSLSSRNGEMQTADGVGRDNNGHYYRVFLSTQSQ